jgi:hypothetical protein
LDPVGERGELAVWWTELLLADSQMNTLQFPGASALTYAVQCEGKMGADAALLQLQNICLLLIAYLFWGLGILKISGSCLKR